VIDVTPALRRSTAAVAALLALGAAPSARAESDLAALTADPDFPEVRFGWRGSMRGTLSVQLPLLRPERFHGFGLNLSPFAEFSGDVGDDEVLPNANWRGRAILETSWERSYEEGTLGQVWVGLTLAHESDHRTSPAPADPQARSLNYWSPAVGVLLRPRRGLLWLDATARVYFITCTRSGGSCFGAPGNDSFGATADVVYDVGRAEAPENAFRFFVALHGGVIAENDAMFLERRVVLHVGTAARRVSGLWQIYGIVWLGNDVGWFRNEVYYQAGAAFAYAP